MPSIHFPTHPEAVASACLQKPGHRLLVGFLFGRAFMKGPASAHKTQKPGSEEPGSHGIIVTAMKQKYSKDYTLSRSGYQLVLPLNLETIIPSDDKVRLLSQFVEELDLTDLYRTYDRIRKNTATPRQMLKIVLYAAMNRLYSSRDIETACRRDINFMFLLEGSLRPITPRSRASNIFIFPK